MSIVGPPAEPTLVLAPERDRSVRRRHPWVFAGAVDRVTGDPAPGATVVVRSADGEPLGRAAYSPSSQIVARMWTFDATEPVDEAFIAARVARAAGWRAGLSGRTDAVRLVFAENDGLPGVIVDRYSSVAVCQLLSTGAERWRDAIADALVALPGIEAVVERSEAAVRRKEGLGPVSGLLRGAEPDEVAIVEDGRRYLVDVGAGHKTGFYLDQRDNRTLVEGLAGDARVLDVCAFTGGFSVAAWRGGARSVVTVESSRPALVTAARNLQVNGLPPSGLVEADAFAELRRRRSLGERFDLIVLDPPKLASSAAQVRRASRAYKDLNLQALGLLAPGGHLVTFSCSGAVDEALFQKIVFGAALDAGRDVQVVGRLTQAADHPVLMSFPEGAYLKGLVCRVMG